MDRFRFVAFLGWMCVLGVVPAIADQGTLTNMQLSPEQKAEGLSHLSDTAGSGSALKNMDPKKKEEIVEKYHRFQDLPPERKDEIRKNWKRYQQMSPEERQKVKERMDHWKNLSPDEKKKLKEKHEQLRQKSPETKAKLKANHERWKNLSPEEKTKIRQEWRKNHPAGSTPHK